MFADRNCFKPAMKLFFGFVLAGSFLCARAPAQQLTSCTVANPSTPCIQKFVDQLPYPPLFKATPVVNGTVDAYEIAARQISQSVLSCSDPSNLSSGCTPGVILPMTTVFAYGSTGFPYNNTASTTVCNANGTDTSPCFFYPAPIVVAPSGKTVHVRWFNDVVCHTGDEAAFSCIPGNFLPYPGALPNNPGGVTPSFTNHTANPSGICNGKATTTSDCQGVGHYAGPVPLIVHLHGTDTTTESDGIPEAWNVPRNGTFSLVSFPNTSGADYCQEGQDLNTYNTTEIVPRDRKCDTMPRTTYDGTGGSRFVYPNRQFGTLLFFHDHALGVTTENVYMGLAGPYILAGTKQSPGVWCNGNCAANPFDFHDDLPSDCSPLLNCALGGFPSVTGGLPEGDCSPAGIQAQACFEAPLVITDKAFNPNGSLKFSENGNVIVVNGKTWPYLNVEPRKYRLRIVIGAPTSRFDLTFPTASNDHPGPVATMTQIGADQGYLPHPAKATKVSLMPGERADVIVDFSSFFSCVAPYSTGCPTSVDLLNANGGGDTGTIMRFNIVPFASCDLTNPDPATCSPFGADTSCNLPYLTCTSSDNLPHRASEVPTTTRQVSLFDDHLGNCTNPGCVGSAPLPWDSTPVTENPVGGSTEIWEMYDFQDQHPMHLHLAEFQVVNREKISCVTNHTPCPVGPGPGETGWKDTVQANGGQITRVRVSFIGAGHDPVLDVHRGLFAWHCHINPHEDNEMMRPMCVQYPANDPDPNHQNANTACLNTP